ncbi:hypothetical protein OPT61_g10170 [Boeremia exigua]|uniref:Uncharacterized protein n=1 Tax=Boeremia exigua TaxID=749465 RepID=A0ACC2HRE0_9PLEO|nr:hypothetical protein OPT61_g10170 [Boeremia exigua]
MSDNEDRTDPPLKCEFCGNSYLTKKTLSRHIVNTCWKSCDECTADNLRSCDSTHRAGPCSTCEAKAQPCTKHAAPLPFTKAERTGLTVKPSDEDGESSSPILTDNAAAHNRRKVPAAQNLLATNTQPNPRGDAEMPPKVNKEAAGRWPQQSENASSVVNANQPLLQPRVLGSPFAPYGGGPQTQLDIILVRLQATRQQNQQSQLDMERRLGPTPPIGLQAPLTYGGQNVGQIQGGYNMASLPAHPTTSTSSELQSQQNPFFHDVAQADAILTLQVHSNTHDKNGQPIFSILHIRRNDIFGPHLAAYCSHRGKQYGADWTFVYRYLAGTQEDPTRQLQIKLTYDLTPADVKDVNYPNVMLRDLNTIHVMHAHPTPSHGAHLPYATVDLLNGETTVYQNPDVTAHWYRAVEHDLRSTVARQQNQLAVQARELARLRA